MSKEKNESLLEQFENLIKEFNKVRKGKYPGTLDKSRDIIIGLISRGTDFIKKIEGENSEYFKSIKETKYSSNTDQFLHVKGVLNALYEQKDNYLDSSIIEKLSNKKIFIINKIETFMQELYHIQSVDEQKLWIKMVLSFFNNELPDTKKYHSIKNLFRSEFIIEEGKFSFSSFSLLANGSRILKELISIVKEDNFEDYNVDFHPKIKEVSLELFRDKHYSEAVFESVKALNNYVKEKAKITDKDLSDAMAKVFNENNPIIKLNELKTRSEIDEQRGFKFLFMGAMTGIRNPLGHETYEINDRNRALEYLSFLSLLFRKAEEGEL